MRKIFLLALCLSYGTWGLAQSTNPRAERGILNLTNWDLSSNKIALNGHWDFYESELISVASIKNKSGNLAAFPEVWDKKIQYGTYHLIVLTSPSTKKLALTIPQLYCSYELWINGEKLTSNGKIGTTEETTIPEWRPQTVLFDNPGDTIDLVLSISNFYHSKGGAKEPIYLGSAEVLEANRSIAVLSNGLEFIILTMLGLSVFVVYYVREEKKKITFYFSLLCLSWAIRCVCSNLYLVTSYLPDINWSFMVKVEYIMLYSAMIWAILFLSRLFPNESSKLIKYILVTLNCSFIVITAAAAPVFFTKWLGIYLSVAGVLLLFGVVIVVKALINERTGVWFLVASIFLSLLLFSYDIFVYEGFAYDYNSVLFSFGYITIFMMLTIALLYHLKIFKGESSLSSLTYEDLYGKK